MKERRIFEIDIQNKREILENMLLALGKNTREDSENKFDNK